MIMVMMMLLMMMTNMIKRMVMMIMRRRSTKNIGVRDSFKSLDVDRINEKFFSPNCEHVNMTTVMMIWWR